MTLNWDMDRNKHDLEYYENYEFRLEYEFRRMLPKSKACYHRILSEMKLLVQGMSQNNAASIMRVLSLGCGPGTDLLAAAWAIIQHQFRGNVELTGVDTFDWDFQMFDSEIKNALKSGHPSMKWEFPKRDMAQYVDWCLNAGRKFDLMIFSYVQAVDLIDLLGWKAPLMLNRGGRIFVIDNFSEGLVTDLQYFHFYEDNTTINVMQNKRLRQDEKRPIFMIYHNDI